ncbi:NINE protein [Schaalia sp. 19OD2882]|uniref:TM2 domain-containing protein n=1 Tax=Schaalia sp. 19OD2882 TaxID=2794089 RepID=UPI001C1EB670|nr:TM2 domain-containing protein [Schaalia sp. 19OD2882]QWW19758.1 NINE protein [Schaalia sp. 19OD2882]
MTAPVPGQPPAKSHVVAMLLAFFLGGIGGADFYLGHVKIAIYKIVALVVGYAFIFIGGIMGINVETGQPNMAGVVISGLGMLILFAVSIWVFVTLIMVILRKGMYGTDSNGQPLV